jgi:hypothetical protein
MSIEEYKKDMEQKIRDVRNEKASLDWVKAKIDPIEKNIVDLRGAINRGHNCTKEEQLKSLNKFRTALVGALGTLILLGISSIFAFANVQANTEIAKESIKEQRSESSRFRQDLSALKTSVAIQQKQTTTLLTTNKGIENSLEQIKESIKEKKKRR